MSEQEQEGEPERPLTPIPDQETPAPSDLEIAVYLFDDTSQTESSQWQENTSRTSGTTPSFLNSSLRSPANSEHTPSSVLTQTDFSWLHDHKKEKLDKSESEFFSQLSAYFSSPNEEKETDSILEGDVSDATSKGSLDGLIVHSEFIDKASEKLFRPPLYTLPSVGLPTILAYKQESRQKPIDYKTIIAKEKSGWLHNLRELQDVKEYWQWKRNMLIQGEHSHLSSEKQLSRTSKLVVEPVQPSKPTSEHNWDQFRESVVSVGFDLCQFCGKNLKPLPTSKQLSTEATETLFCCKQYQDLFEFLMREEDLLKLKAGLEMIDISPHLPFSSLLEREQAKERAAMRLRDREMEKFMKKAKENQRRLSAVPKRLTTIAFHLSTSLDFVTLSDIKEEEDEFENIFTVEGDDTFKWYKDSAPPFTVKHYKNGNKFLTAFPDGAAQIFYPSGNLAILIFTDRPRITCIVQEDRADEPAIQAIFSSYGRCTCYHPNGVIWININAVDGLYLDEQGTRVKRWCWRDHLSPLLFAPFKPIFLSLNENIGVRILEQEQISITFLAMGKQAKFKVGAKLKLKKVSNEFLTNPWITEDELLLQDSQLKVRTAINKLCIALNFPNSPKTIPLPLYLVSQQQKLSQLYASIKMEESTEEENGT
ncbi:glutamate-rich protein 6 isoform X2 [Scyliorhinus canicula]|uniref:glutamate-rich protein 6 isoform X2 n=1 Tax=Scyliorhinus canicula TaxID=7830 RepID=UPI0018F28D6B|nr:glutamate-rich protein 6 isoform X2 [Scyliorhinus canicula]